MKHSTIQIFAAGLAIGGIGVALNGILLLAVLVVITLVVLLTISDLGFNYEIVEKKVRK